MLSKVFNHWLINDITDFIKFSQDTSNMGLYENIYYKKKAIYLKTY